MSSTILDKVPVEIGVDTERVAFPINSLHVQNFRCFKNLSVSKFDRVNLITGKNNVGKTTFLESIWILINKGLPEIASEILLDREEIEKENEDIDRDIISQQRPNKKPSKIDYSFLFNSSEEEEHVMVIESSGDRRVEVKYRINIGINTEKKRGYYFLHGKSESVIPVSKYDDLSLAYYHDLSPQKNIKSFLIPSSGLDRALLLDMWDQIELTPREDFVIQILKIIDNNIVRVDLKGKKRVPYVRLENSDRAIPLASLGGGSVTAFSLALSMLSSSNGVFLIDEIENGIHYSALKKMWEFIFLVSRRFNVQVFATTHSKECIEAFQKVAAQDDDPESGMLIRLTNHDGDIIATNFDEEELEVMVRRGLEVR